MSKTETVSYSIKPGVYLQPGGEFIVTSIEARRGEMKLVVSALIEGQVQDREVSILNYSNAQALAALGEILFHCEYLGELGKDEP